ncbi:hypothetical protein LWI29_015959 [Acer saccharum]|uniref:Bifunctional inhibitor/plant lipid transfer protein/seed storage helical domain-containing protein n=2 Tax=Acer TaxID=4022 RepID=A0A5C7IX53_9ROSI|nr:hypothetical protein LWI29_015959 [Acer saccharum]TXG73096.1 hypothetical protein EZV62_001675 [Acer yangbiense]
MDSKLATMVPFSSILVLILLGFATSDVNQDRSECADQLVGLATCLPYVGGDSKAPTIDCCTGLKQVMDKSKKCLCILIKDRDDPKLGLKINATLAASLPSACHSPANISECISILHLAPSSPDAKVFEGFANISQGHGTTPVKGSSSSSAEEKSGGGKAKRWIGSVVVEMACGISVLLFTLMNIF